MSAALSTSSGRKTVAVLAAQLTRSWGAEFMSGVMDAAEEQDLNVVCFVGGKPGALQSPDPSRISYGLYDLVPSGRFDGLLLCADLAHGSTQDEIRQFCRSLGPAPIVSHAIEAEGVSSFSADNSGGMRAALKHLIEVHKHKHIAFIRGLPGQGEAEQRFQAYREELQAHKIPFNERLVVDGDFSSESGRMAVHELVDERGLRVRSIVTANDRMAFGAMEALQQRGLQVPDEVALVGFDDIQEADSLGVPLTTVRQPFYELGRQSLLALVKRMDGKDVPPITVLPASLVVRWSCGCLPESLDRAIVMSREVALTGRLGNKREAAISALLDAAEIPENHLYARQFGEVFGRTWDVFLASLGEADSSHAFLKMIQACVEGMQRQDRDASHWQNVISVLRKHALGGIQSDAAALRAENLFQQARMLAGELAQRAQAYRRLRIEREEQMLGAFGFSIAPAMSLPEIGEAISKNFPAMRIERWYVMFYSEVSAPGSISAPPPQDYSVLIKYDRNGLEIPETQTRLEQGRLIPRDEATEDRRYSAMVMPLALARNRFGFMWTEMGARDWEIYVRVRNLVSSALLRTMLAQQREQAQREIERLLKDARQRASELAVARDAAEKAAVENARLYEREQASRGAMEALARASRQLSSLGKVEEVPQKILDELGAIIPFDRGLVFLEDVNGVPYLAAHTGLPPNERISELKYQVQTEDGPNDLYDAVARMKEAIQIGDLSAMQGWQQPDWLPLDRSWLGLPLFYQNRIMGMLVVTREKPWAFNRDAALVSKAYAVQAAIALENAHLYDEVTRFNQVMERMVAEKVEELKITYLALEQHDKNKSKFINVAAHELRTPLTVIKGYLGMLRADKSIEDNPLLVKALDGVLQGANRLHQIVNAMLDVARLENQTVVPHIEPVMIAPLLRIIHKEYADDLTARRLTLILDDSINVMPPLLADPELLQKAFDQVIVNAIKFTPDGGQVTVSAAPVQDEQLGACGELRVQDTGIGIDPDNHRIIFDKLHQLGKVEFHSSSRTNFKGGGPGLGLAIAAGIVKAHKGKIWVESPGFDEEKLPGSTFFLRFPLAK
jgi:DNA-binding LacI/PurR family transcriptional regulator/signal transduction histidine kinase